MAGVRFGPLAPFLLYIVNHGSLAFYGYQITIPSHLLVPAFFAYPLVREEFQLQMGRGDDCTNCVKSCPAQYHIVSRGGVNN